MAKQNTLSEFVKGEKPVVFADDREINSKVVEFLKRKGAEVKEMRLDVGDYLISGKVAIERKTTGDFLNSLMDGRLFSQLRNMVEYEKPLLLIEGTPRELFALREIKQQALIGALASISLDLRVPVLFSESKAQTAEFIYSIAKREQFKKDKSISLRKKKALGLEEQQRFIIESLPLVGPKTAKAMLKKFGSVKNTINATKKDLEELPKIGEKKAKKIIEVIEKDYDKRL